MSRRACESGETIRMKDMYELVMDWPVDWREYIHCDPNILMGKPVVKGTRLSVELIVSLVALGSTEEQILESYPHLTREALRAALEYAADLVAHKSPRTALSKE